MLPTPVLLGDGANTNALFFFVWSRSLGFDVLSKTKEKGKQEQNTLSNEYYFEVTDLAFLFL